MTDHPTPLPATRAQPTALPARIGPYRIDAQLGQGGMGVVYAGYDAHLDRPVAIKVLFPHLARDHEFADRFLREARTSARIEHPGVVAVYAADELAPGEGCYIAMQLVDGVELHRILKEGGALPVDLALAVAREIADALGAAHAQGVVHRDVKPDNVLVDRTGRIRVSDFGLARPIDREARLTETGVFLGTPEYSAPEQCQTARIDHRADLYSLGVVLYEMLTGQLPHHAPTPYALFRRICEEAPVPLGTLNHAVPKAVEALVMEGLLAKEPGARLPDARALVARIDAILPGICSPAKDHRAELAARVARLAPPRPPTARTLGAVQPAIRPAGDHDSHQTYEYCRTAIDGVTSTAPPSVRRAPLPVRAIAIGAVLVVALAGGIVAFGRPFDKGEEAAPEPTPPGPEVPPPGGRPQTVEEWRAGLHFPVRVAVLDFEGRTPREREGDAAWYTVGLTELVFSGLCASDDLMVLGREFVQPEIESSGGAISHRDLARRLQAALVVTGTYWFESADRVSCHVTVSAADGGFIVARGQKSGSPDELFEIVRELSDDVLAKLIRSLGRPGPEANLAATPPAPSVRGEEEPNDGYPKDALLADRGGDAPEVPAMREERPRNRPEAPRRAIEFDAPAPDERGGKSASALDPPGEAGAIQSLANESASEEAKDRSPALAAFESFCRARLLIEQDGSKIEEAIALLQGAVAAQPDNARYTRELETAKRGLSR